MNKFKGTKGKWPYEGGDNSSIDIVLENNATISISRYDRYGSGLVGTRLEMEANALLISKAPEMLEMLESLENDNGAIPEFMWDKIKQLIKEATEL